MRFFKNGDLYQTWTITGPHHVMLGLSFAEEFVEDVAVFKWPANSEGATQRVDQSRLMAAVKTAVRAMSKEKDKPLWVSRIAFVEDDTPAYDIYASLARAITERYLSGGDFQPIDGALPHVGD